MAGMFSKRKALLPSMHSYSSKLASNLRAASFPAVLAMLSWKETNFMAIPACFLSKAAPIALMYSP
jgi:hypothetical protein